MQVDQSLVDPHLVSVPSLGTLTTWRLPGGVSQDLGGESDWTLDVQLLVLGSRDQVSADLLEVLDVSRSEGDSDSVDLGAWGRSIHILVLGDVAHFWLDQISQR